MFKDKVIYQIYPMSFNDSNNDGIGDINGITEKLDYLKNLGVDMLWITPMYKSPKNDNGYDVEDYYSIDEDFGSMEDFDNLLKKAKSKNIEIIMDIVANHTSTKHIWFKKALKGDKKYQDYYIFRDKNYVDSHPIQSVFGGDAWEYVEDLNLYYLHNFDKTQGDLDWDNIEVRKEIYKILNFWLDKGVKGFRFDVIDMISKDFDNLQMSNGENLHKYIIEMNEKTFGKYTSLTVGETWSADIDHAKKYSNIDSSEFSMIFTFEHIMFHENKWESKIDKNKLKNILTKYQKELHGKGWNSLFFNNHDLPRVISRYGDENYPELSGKMLATLLHGMEGTPYIYQGEEIGMTNRKWNLQEISDIEALNYYNTAIKTLPKEKVLENINKISRDNARTPMQWNSSLYGGFSNVKPWIIMNENYKSINVKNSLEDKNSIFYTYQKLIKLRKELEVIKSGEFNLIETSKNLFIYTRTYRESILYVVCNLSDKDQDINPVKGEILISNYKDSKVNTLRPYEGKMILI